MKFLKIIFICPLTAPQITFHIITLFDDFGKLKSKWEQLEQQNWMAYFLAICIKHIPWPAIWDSGSVRRKRCDEERSSRILYPSPSGQHSFPPAATPIGPSFPVRLPGAGQCDQRHPARWPHCGNVKSRTPAAAPQSRPSVPLPPRLHAAVSGIWGCSPAVPDSSWPPPNLHVEPSSLLYYKVLLTAHHPQL